MVMYADALLAALVPVAPASGAPATDPRRTVGAVVRWRGQDHPDEEWLLVGNNKAVALKIRKPHLLDCGTNEDGGGDEFIRWATRAECAWHGIPYVARPLPGAPLAAPSPAATPAARTAAWVPSVGDVVQDKDHPEFAQLLVTRVDAPAFYAKVITCTGAPTDEVMRYADRYRFVRRATSSERAAAGLPVDESATKPVDREGLVAAMNKAARLWVESADKRSLAECHADAAIAFMAKGPAFDRADFNEAKEREAALKAYTSGVDGSIDPDGTRYPACRDSFSNGWLARARVAAKGGA